MLPPYLAKTSVPVSLHPFWPRKCLLHAHSSQGALCKTHTHTQCDLVAVQKETPVLPVPYEEGPTRQVRLHPSALLLGPCHAPLGPCVCHLECPPFQTTPEPSAVHFALGSLSVCNDVYVYWYERYPPFTSACTHTLTRLEASSVKAGTMSVFVCRTTSSA